jgi:hypothetical protein
MSSIKAKREFPDRSARDCYQACLRALTGAGYKFFKQRDYAWFAIATNRVEGDEVTCNLLTSLGPPTFIELNLTAAKMEEARLQELANELLQITADNLA